MKKFLVITISILSLFACSKNNIEKNDLEIISNETKIQSNAGLNIYVKEYIKFWFVKLDENKDNFVDIEEGLKSKIVNLENAKMILSKVDKNNDNKLSLEESIVFNWYELFGYNKNLVRKVILEQNLKGIFTCDEKLSCTGSITSKEQFMKSIHIYGNTPEIEVEKANLAFYIGDKNKDGKLSFSEVEDIYYSYMQSAMNKYTPTNSPTPVQTNP